MVNIQTYCISCRYELKVFHLMYAAFTCQQKGIFPNTDSNNCTTFVSCDQNLNAAVYACVEGAYFWPDKKGCFSQYNCAQNIMPGDEDPCGEAIFQSRPDKSSADCTRYWSCDATYNSENSVYVKQVTSQQCETGTVFRPEFGCINSTYHQFFNYECTAEGIFENPNDCSTFVKCWKFEFTTEGNNSGYFYPDLHYCPSNTKFNPVLKKCDSFYNCNGIDPHNGTDPCLHYNDNSSLVVSPYVNDADASSYIACQYDFNGLLGILDVIWKKIVLPIAFFHRF